MMILPPSISQPSPIFREISYITQEVSEIGFYESEAESGFMLFSAQYWLAPTLVVHTDPNCCRYLITNELDNITDDYSSIIEFAEGWHLVEFE